MLDYNFPSFHLELTSDIVIEAHLNELYDTLLEQNLLRILEPFSVIEINHVATLMEMPVQIIEAKLISFLYFLFIDFFSSRLSQMILDKKLLGILDQGAGHLIIFESSPEDVKKISFHFYFFFQTN